jgi:hypothetical protein
VSGRKGPNTFVRDRAIPKKCGGPTLTPSSRTDVFGSYNEARACVEINVFIFMKPKKRTTAKATSIVPNIERTMNNEYVKKYTAMGDAFMKDYPTLCFYGQSSSATARFLSLPVVLCKKNSWRCRIVLRSLDSFLNAVNFALLLHAFE